VNAAVVLLAQSFMIVRIVTHFIFLYKDRIKKKWKTMSLDAMEFIRRFLNERNNIRKLICWILKNESGNL
jgi:hypothetical protein